MDKDIKKCNVLTTYIFPVSPALFQTMYSGHMIAIYPDSTTYARFVLHDLQEP